MKIKTTLVLLLIVISLGSKAQTVTIPDANFVNWLTAHIPSAMSGNQMDTSSVAVKTLTRIDVEGLGIADLTGVQYFSSLKTLDCGNDFQMPNPNTLTSLPVLPNTLDTLICGENQLTSLPALPNSLKLLKCYENKLTSLPTLPGSLVYLDCRNNQLTSLPVLPGLLAYLNCGVNQLLSLPALPNSLYHIQCQANQLTNLPALPSSISYLDCEDNQLTSLPSLPSSLAELFCSVNKLTVLPALPNLLMMLYCYDNQLTSLPTLPNSLSSLLCFKNLLTNLPVLPSSLSELECFSNNISCFPTFPTTLINPIFFSITPNPFTCLPNYVAAMDAGTLAYPLCVNGDSINNPNGCPGAIGIVGFTYKDNNANCVKEDNVDSTLMNVHELLYDGSNNLLNQTYSAINGVYHFSDTAGTYIVKIDTAYMPFTAQCIQPGIDSTIVLTSGNPLVDSVNFNLICKPGFDIGVQAAAIIGWVFPGQQHSLHIVGGDMSHWYGLHCAAGLSGQVQITVTGPVTYKGVAPGALTPSVSGKLFTYTIANFDAVNNQTAFGLLFAVDTTAQAGDWICVSVVVTPTSGDNNISNNNFSFCYQVWNSHDPNMKEVYPTDVQPGYTDYFTYTVHFQNTGNAPAMNIRLLDTLDSSLDLKTFQLINYSHKNNIVELKNNILTFRFPNIMLADSTSDPEGSKGFVQYRIKPKAGLPAGTQIKNTANIYFDNNPAIVTNTTINNFMVNASVKENKTASFNVYPNPGNGLYYVQLSEKMNLSKINIQVYNLLGEAVWNTKAQHSLIPIDLGSQPNGIYIIKINGTEQSLTQRIIKQ